MVEKNERACRSASKVVIYRSDFLARQNHIEYRELYISFPSNVFVTRCNSERSGFLASLVSVRVEKRIQNNPVIEEGSNYFEL